MGESILLQQSLSLSLSTPNSLSHRSSIHLSHLSIRSTLAVPTRSIRAQPNQFVARVVSDSKAPTLIFESPGGGDSEVRPDIGGGDGGSLGGGRGGGGGGGGGGEGGSSEGDNREESKKGMAMSMSQKFTLGYAALVGVGGLMGYMKTGSTKSLAAGGISAVVLGYVYTALPTNPTLASAIGLGISAALLGVMGSRFKKSGKVFPAGVVSAMSLVMTAGYLHGMVRSTSH